jgi:hypothetical protein
MLMKVMYVQMVMYLMDGSLKMRISIFHLKKTARLNILGMITIRNQYKGFTTQESINTDRIVNFPDRFSFEVKKKTVVVLDNASVHRNRKIKEMRKIWEDRGLFLFYLPEDVN